MITLLIVVPVIAALLLQLFPRGARPVAMGAVILQLLMVVWLISGADYGQALYALDEYPWFEISLQGGQVLHAQYLVALDGLNLPLLVLTVIAMLVAVLTSRPEVTKPRAYFGLLLLLDAALIGCFTSFDLLLFFLFFELMLVPLYFLIGIWGGPDREYAAVKFFVYTFFGSILILLGFIFVTLSYRLEGGILTFDFIELLQTQAGEGSLLDPENVGSMRQWIFLALLAGFAIKVPVVPLHTWLPDAHVEASTPVSIILAAVVLKVGAYGLLRFVVPLFAGEAYQWSAWISSFAVCSIVYGALNAMASKDLKRMIAYSSISHMGFVILGIFSVTVEGIQGAQFQMVSHGILSTALFFIAGVLYDRTGDRRIDHYSGLAKSMPKFAALTLIIFVASLGMPGFSGFIGELLVLSGAFMEGPIDWVPLWAPALGAVGLILTAGYLIWTYQRLFMGTPMYTPDAKFHFFDLNMRERITLITLATGSLLLGLWPQPLLDVTSAFSLLWVADVQENLKFLP